MKTRRFVKGLAISLIALFTLSIVLPACGSSRKGTVKSQKGMGDKRDVNRHVWGK